VEGVLREQRGTCSTKHLFLGRILAERFPDTEPVIVHRVYTLDRDRASELFGASVAATVPDDGLVDVPRYLEVTLGGQRVEIDATFPGPPWDGLSSLPLACGEGRTIRPAMTLTRTSGGLRSGIATRQSASRSSRRSPSSLSSAARGVSAPSPRPRLFLQRGSTLPM